MNDVKGLLGVKIFHTLFIDSRLFLLLLSVRRRSICFVIHKLLDHDPSVLDIIRKTL